jgi:hypothetical protein
VYRVLYKYQVLYVVLVQVKNVTEVLRNMYIN